jgi:hypothetical protein
MLNTLSARRVMPGVRLQVCVTGLVNLRVKFAELKRRMQSEEYQQQLRDLNSNREAMRQHVLKMESRVARCIAGHVHHSARPTDVGISEIESELEWFLTWRLKLEDLPSVMWCDGVQDLAITQAGGLSYEIEAKAWIGPESDVNVLSLCRLRGMVRLEPNNDRLSSYKLCIDYEGQAYEIDGAI